MLFYYASALTGQDAGLSYTSQTHSRARAAKITDDSSVTDDDSGSKLPTVLVSSSVCRLAVSASRTRRSRLTATRTAVCMWPQLQASVSRLARRSSSMQVDEWKRLAKVHGEMA